MSTSVYSPDLAARGGRGITEDIRALNTEARRRGLWGFADLAAAGERFAYIREHQLFTGTTNETWILCFEGLGGKMTDAELTWLRRNAAAAWRAVKHVRECPQCAEVPA